jgi:hypothetical protein
MSRESFGEKLDRGTEPILEDIDRVPPPESYPEPMPDEESESRSDFDIKPGEELIDEEENKRQEDEVEETYKKKPGDKTPVPEKKLDDLEINKKIIEAQNAINKIKEAISLSRGQEEEKQYKEFLKDAETELEKWLNYR